MKRFQQIIPKTPFYLHPCWSLPSHSVQSNKYLLLLRLKNISKDLIPIISFPVYSPPFGSILLFSPLSLSIKRNEPKNIPFLLFSQNVNGDIQNTLWEVSKPFYFYPETNIMITLFIDLSTESLYTQDHIMMSGLFPQNFSIIMNPFEMEKKTHRFAQWMMPFQNQTLLMKFMTLTRELENHQEGFFTNINEAVARWEAPAHSSQSGFIFDMTLKKNCGYIALISGTCMSGSTYIHFSTKMKQRLIPPSYRTSWDEKETCEYIVYIPPIEIDREVEMGVLCADLDAKTIFIFHQFVILQLTQPMFGNFWEIPYSLYDEKEKNAVIWKTESLSRAW